MLRENTEIGPGLLFTVTVSLLLGLGIIQTANVAARYGGHSGYWGLIGACLLSILVIFAASDLQKMYPGKSLMEYAPSILGKIPGKIAGLVFLLLIFSLLLLSVRSIAEVINLYFLQRTPISVTAGLFIIAVAYLASRGIEGITKTCAFFLPLAFIVIVLTLLISFQNFDFDQIRPVLYIRQGHVSAVFQLLYAFSTLAALFFFLPYLNDQEKAMPVVLKGTFLSVAVIFVVIVAVMGTFGARGVLRYSWPTMELTRVLNLPYLFSSFGGLFVVTWLSQVYIGAGACYFAAAQGSTQLFSCLHYKWFILILLPLILFLSLFLPGTVEVRRYFEYFRIAGAIILFSIPLLLWITAKLKNSRGETNAA